MNRRNFFKVVTGFVAGIFVGSAKSEPKALICSGKNGTLCPRCKFNYPEPSTTIDPNSEWAKQKPLTLDDLRKVKEEAINLAEESGKVVYFPKGTYNLKYGIIV